MLWGAHFDMKREFTKLLLFGHAGKYLPLIDHVRGERDTNRKPRPSKFDNKIGHSRRYAFSKGNHGT